MRYVYEASQWVLLGLGYALLAITILLVFPLVVTLSVVAYALEEE